MVQLTITFLFGIFASCLSQFQFSDLHSVHDITIEFVEEFNCGCIVILKPSNATYDENFFLDRLTSTLAKGEGKIPKQVMSYTLEQYMLYYNLSTRKEAGSCFKWLSLVMVTDSTKIQMLEVSKSFAFTKCAWLMFTNGSLDFHLNGVNWWFNSEVWVVQPISDNEFSLSEVYHVGPDFPIRITLQGTWTRHRGLHLSANYYKAHRLDMEGWKLKTGLLKNWPLATLERNVKGEIDGYYGAVWLELESLLNFTTTVIINANSEVPPGMMQENGEWTGMLGMAQRQEIDALLAELDYSTSRLQVVDLLMPISRTGYQVFYKNDGYLMDWLAVFRPFDSLVWTSLLAWVIVGSLVIYITSSISARTGLNQAQNLSLVNSAFFVMQTLCVQGCSSVPKVWANRILFFLCYLLAAVILPSYSAALISSLAKKTPVKPFETLRGILETDYQLVLPLNTSAQEYFSDSLDPEIKKIRARTPTDVPLKKISSYAKAFTYICTTNKRAIFLLEEPTLLKINEGSAPCKLSMLSQPVSSVYQSMALKKNSPYRGSANYFILRLAESGVLQRLAIKYKPKNWQDENKPDLEIKMTDVALMFVFLAAFQIISLALLVLEIRFAHIPKT